MNNIFLWFIISVIAIGVVWFFVRGRSDISLNQARAIAEQEINRNSSHSMIITKVLEEADGWIFYYTTEANAQTKDVADQVPGNAPLKIKKDGTMMYVTFFTPGK